MDIAKYAGIDLHKRTSFVTLIDKKGQIHSQINLDNADPAKIINMIKSSKVIRVAVEATMNWYWMIELCEANGL